MNSKSPFRWRHFLPEIILLCVRWYLRYPLSYRTLDSLLNGGKHAAREPLSATQLSRNLKEMMAERGLRVDHTTIYRWVIAYSPEIKVVLQKNLRSQ